MTVLFGEATLKLGKNGCSLYFSPKSPVERWGLNTNLILRFMQSPFFDFRYSFRYDDLN